MILGAGFSKNAGLPLQNDFPKMLLSREFNEPNDRAITEILRNFLKDVFGWNTNPKQLPPLEDIFTVIDLSTGNGHNLGSKYTPQKLRAIRRMLIYRIFSILDSNYDESDDIANFLDFYLNGSLIDTHFIVLNWDIVLERHLEKTVQNPKIDYCIYSKSKESDYIGKEPYVAVSKIHGSSNWVYCDNCRSITYDRTRKLSLHVRAGLLKSDFELFGKDFRDIFSNHCLNCGSIVGPHIATFSYKKSFRTHAFTSSWLAAEQILDQANRWIFIGYSLPEADFEFRHLLKTSQLKFSLNTKEIHAVFYKDKVAQKRYEKFFGKDKVTIYQGGLTEYVHEITK
ncbi:hypothetical protein H1S01_11265 [Heliobacterium chlorum]|uniref:SIR2-like domain-containing protein n=1 Tax=Heliobacterium chlorum TaxID=2698 RepID=A0ABR7T2T8_HELCL|nr:hypothetical protein [Heliobacterium chlorum]MBC9785087.1 hypothetical protein [Heliobacterium chlorum]